MDARQAFADVVRELTPHLPKIPPRAAVRAVMQRAGVSEHQARAAMWHAIDDGLIDITRDWYLVEVTKRAESAELDSGGGTGSAGPEPYRIQRMGGKVRISPAGHDGDSQAPVDAE